MYSVCTHICMCEYSCTLCIYMYVCIWADLRSKEISPESKVKGNYWFGDHTIWASWSGMEESTDISWSVGTVAVWHTWSHGRRIMWWSDTSCCPTTSSTASTALILRLHQSGGTSVLVNALVSILVFLDVILLFGFWHKYLFWWLWHKYLFWWFWHKYLFWYTFSSTWSGTSAPTFDAIEVEGNCNTNRNQEKHQKTEHCFVNGVPHRLTWIERRHVMRITESDMEWKYMIGDGGIQEWVNNNTIAIAEMMKTITTDITLRLHLIINLYKYTFIPLFVC